MYSDCLKLDQISINTGCFSEDGKLFYAFSEYYNELYQIDLSNYKTISLGQLGLEKDTVQMIYEMYWSCGKVLCIPRNAENLYVYDTKTKKQLIIPKRQLATDIEMNWISFMTVKDGKDIYFIYRGCLRVFKINMETCEVEHIPTDFENEEVCIMYGNAFGSSLVMHSKDQMHSYIFKTQSQKLEKLTVPQEVIGYDATFYDGSSMWFYCRKSDILYQCDLWGHILHRYEANRSDENSIILGSYKNRLYMIANNSIGIVEDNQLKECEYSDSPLKDIFFYRFSGKENIYFLRSYYPATYGLMPAVSRYFMLNLETMEIKEIVFSLPQGQLIEEVRKRSLKSFYKEIYYEDSNYNLTIFIKENFKELKRFGEGTDLMNVGQGVYSKMKEESERC